MIFDKTEEYYKNPKLSLKILISASVSNEVLAILILMGRGKTTLLKCITGLHLDRRF